MCAICSLNWRKHVTPCFDCLSILKVRDVAKMEMAKFVHKSVNHSLPKYFQTFFNKVSLAHKRSSRSSCSDNLAICLLRTSHAQRIKTISFYSIYSLLPYQKCCFPLHYCNKLLNLEVPNFGTAFPKILENLTQTIPFKIQSSIIELAQSHD